MYVWIRIEYAHGWEEESHFKNIFRKISERTMIQENNNSTLVMT